MGTRPPNEVNATSQPHHAAVPGVRLLADTRLSFSGRAEHASPKTNNRALRPRLTRKEVRMENPRPEKVAVVDEVREKLRNADAAVLTEYRGLNVAAMAKLRAELRPAGGEVTVYKNTLVRFAARELGLEIDDFLTGPTAIAFVPKGTGDAVSVAKVLKKYASENDALVIKGGVLGDRRMSAADVKALAEVPPREQLLAELAGLMAAPAQQFVNLLDAVPRDFAYALNALIEKQEGAAA
jgi:large subunit ribosomal protein L10